MKSQNFLHTYRTVPYRTESTGRRECISLAKSRMFNFLFISLFFIFKKGKLYLIPANPVSAVGTSRAVPFPGLSRTARRQKYPKHPGHLYASLCVTQRGPGIATAPFRADGCAPMLLSSSFSLCLFRMLCTHDVHWLGSHTQYGTTRLSGCIERITPRHRSYLMIVARKRVLAGINCEARVNWTSVSCLEYYIEKRKKTSTKVEKSGPKNRRGEKRGR